MSYSIQEIKQLNNVISYAGSHGLNVVKEKDRTPSFIDPGDNDTCVVYYRDWWFDFKTNTGGDVIDLCAFLNHNGDRGSAIRELGGGNLSWKKPTQNLNNQIALWHKNLKHRDYLHNRGINDDTIDRLKIGENQNRIIIPYWKNGYIYSWIGRELGDREPKYFKQKKEGIFEEGIPWGVHTLGKSDTLIIAEGAFDALSFEQEGYSVLATMGANFSRDSLDLVRSAVLSHQNTIILLDSDKTGQKNTQILAQHLFKHQITRFSIGNLPNGYKDVSEYYQENKELDTLIEKPIPGLRYLCSGLTYDELRPLLFKTARFVGTEDINLLLKSLRSEYDEDWLKELGKQLVKAPPETMIANEIIKEHQLIYSEAQRLHEFIGTHWEYRTDTAVKKYIDKALGKFARNSLASSVLNTVKTRSNQEVEFNKKHLMNFRNGTLELDTGNFRKASPLDLMTVCADYDYDPNANCPKFQDYLIDITDNVPEKIELLQEIFGYAMFPENTLQKCAIFTGKGSNGKSLLLTILENVYGEENVSKIDVSSLNSEFQRIQLKDSLINIAPDIKADMKGAEDYFKRVIAGDPINGCYKGEDFINFVPHSKFIISANAMIRPNDTSYGMERRMLFMDFPVKFVDDPIYPNERKLNPNLKDSLLKELPGIFNWAYVGYKRLMNNQRFTETAEHKKMLEEFRAGVNPIYEFCKEFIESHSVFTVKQAYMEYYSNYDNRISERAFSMALAKTMKDHFSEFKKCRVENKRAYKYANLPLKVGN